MAPSFLPGPFLSVSAMDRLFNIWTVRDRKFFWSFKVSVPRPEKNSVPEIAFFLA